MVTRPPQTIRHFSRRQRMVIGGAIIAVVFLALLVLVMVPSRYGFSQIARLSADG